MSKSVSLEWSLFGVSNPLDGSESVIEQTFEDRYILWTPRATVKARRNIVKHKVLLDTTDDINTYNVEQFANNPNVDPLRSFLELHGLGERYDSGGITLR